MKWRRSTTSSSVSSLAAASALRGLPSSRAISPNISPGLMTFSVTSLPSPETELMRTRPRSTAIIEEPLSPRWKMVWPRRTRRSEANFRISSSSSGSHGGEQRAAQQGGTFRVALKPCHERLPVPMPRPAVDPALGDSRAQYARLGVNVVSRTAMSGRRHHAGPG